MPSTSVRSGRLYKNNLVAGDEELFSLASNWWTTFVSMSAFPLLLNWTLFPFLSRKSYKIVNKTKYYLGWVLS